VAKRKSDAYLPDHATWLKIRNSTYSQWIGREELFERERGSDPDFQVWDACAAACSVLGNKLVLPRTVRHGREEWRTETHRDGIAA
jgi:hypothetical protein